MAEPKVNNTKVNTGEKKLVLGDLAIEADRMTAKLIAYHEMICEQMKTYKSRGLSTVESAVRNAVANLDRLPDAIEKATLTTTKTAAKNSRLVKPKTAIK